jgi:predicted MFS family arabinose efflux permease
MPFARPATITDIAPARPSRLPLLGLLALSAAACTDVVTDLLPAGLLPQMSASLRVPEFRIGYLVSAFAIASAVAAIPVTAGLTRISRRVALIGVLVGFALCNGVTAISPSYPLTLAARLLAGVMGGALWSMLAGYAALIVRPDRRARAIAIVLAGITVALCLPAGTALAAAIGWRASFALLSAVALVLVAWVRWAVPIVTAGRDCERVPVRLVATMPGIRGVLVVTFLLLTAHQAMYTYIAPFAERTGFGRTGLVLLEFGLATACGIWLTGLVADRHLRATLCVALAFIAVGMFGLALASGNGAVLLASVALWGAAFGGAPTLLQTALIDASGPAGADVATAMQTTVYNTGIAAGALAGGLVLSRTGAQNLPWLTMTLVSGALGIVLLARRHSTGRRPPRPSSQRPQPPSRRAGPIKAKGLR